MLHEKYVLEELLKIPISNIEFHDGVVSIYSNDKHVGDLPASGTSEEAVHYTLTDSSLNALNWSQVYNDNKNDIHNVVILKFDNRIPESSITPWGFRQLKVVQDDGSERTVECVFEQGQWHAGLFDY